MTARRVYSKKKVFELLHSVKAHGSYTRLLDREGIKPLPTPDCYVGPACYDASQVDQLIKDIKA